MTADLTREQAREQIARALAAGAGFPALSIVCRADADAALTVLWPVVEGLRAERDAWRKECASAVSVMERMAQDILSLEAELAHAHTVIARHVEPRREGNK